MTAIVFYIMMPGAVAGLPSTGGLALVNPSSFLAVIAKQISNIFGGIYPAVKAVPEYDNGGIFIHQPDEHGIIAMPPAVMVKQFLAVVNKSHPPAQAIIALTFFFKTIAGKGRVQSGLFK